MHLMFARGLGHLVVIPLGGLLAMSWAHLGITWMIAVDVLAVMLLEAALVGGPLALAVGAKSVIPAAVGAYVLPKVLPTPTTTAVVFCAILTAATIAGVVWYLIRVRRIANPDSQFRRTVASLTFLTLAATAEVSIAGHALTMGRLEPIYIAAAFAPGPLWLAAFYLQARPVQARPWLDNLFPDVSGRTGLVVGAR